MMADWWQDVGNMADFFPDAPALAVDFGVNGPPPDLLGYHLAYGVQSTAADLPLYPDAEAPRGSSGLH